MQSLDLVGRREIFFLLRAVNNVRILFAQQNAIGRNDDDFEPINLSNSGASVSAVPVIPASFLYMRK